jgi:hypothetical protein
MPGSRTRGQALTEFLLVSLALIPLFLLLPMIGKYQDINHATQMASRYAAFDAILRNDSQNSWKPKCGNAFSAWPAPPSSALTPRRSRR